MREAQVVFGLPFARLQPRRSGRSIPYTPTCGVLPPPPGVVVNSGNGIVAVAVVYTYMPGTVHSSTDMRWQDGMDGKLCPTSASIAKRKGAMGGGLG